MTGENSLSLLQTNGNFSHCVYACGDRLNRVFNQVVVDLNHAVDGFVDSVYWAGADGGVGEVLAVWCAQGDGGGGGGVAAAGNLDEF